MVCAPAVWLGSAGGGQQFSLFSLPAMEFVHCLTSEDKVSSPSPLVTASPPW